MVARRVEGVQIERTADEILAVKEGSLEAHAINQSAAAVYDLCDGNTSKSDMAAEIYRRTGLPADDEIVDLALSELVETGLVLLDDPEPRSAVSRRALIRRLALSSTLALMLPVVETVVVPPAETAGQTLYRQRLHQQSTLVRRSYRAFDASIGVGRGPSRNQIVIVKRLPANASVSQRTGHTSWNMSLGKNTMLLSTGVSVVYVAAAVLPEGVTQVSYTLSSPPVKRRGLA